MGDDNGCLPVVCAAVLVLLVGIVIGVSIADDSTHQLRKEAIERGFAEYNPKTGQWQWKELK